MATDRVGILNLNLTDKTLDLELPILLILMKQKSLSSPRNVVHVTFDNLNLTDKTLDLASWWLVDFNSERNSVRFV